MAAGAIPPPLFFERRRHEGILAFENGILGNTGKHPASIMQSKVWQALARCDRSPPKDI
jgi:hypothetical protein